jgi:peptide/nickel transport system substrate-binding protein
MPGYEVCLEAFPGYWGPKPAYARVNFRLLQDAQTRAMALMSGDVDVLADIGAILPEQVQDLRKASGVTLKSREVATTHYLVFNCRQTPFSNREARRWLLSQIGRLELVRRVAGSVAIPARNTYSRLARDYDFGLLRIPQEPGAPPLSPGRPLKILLHNLTVQRWPYLDLAQSIHQVLARAGMSAEIQVAEAGLYYQAYQKGEFDLAMTPNTLMTGDPDFFYSYYLAGDAPSNPGWRNPPADRLIAATRREMDPRKRRELIRGVEQIVNKEAPLWPLFHERALYAHGPRVKELTMDYFFRPDLLAARPAAKD